jgi:outer membrane protein
MDSTEEKLPDVPSGDVESLIQNALVNRPDIIAALGKIRAAEATLSSARANYYPTISLLAQAYENFGNLSTQGSSYYSVSQPGASIVLMLNLPLFIGGTRDTHKVSVLPHFKTISERVRDHVK